MKKISLDEANKLLKKKLDDNAYTAYIQKNEGKSISKLTFLKNLFIAVKVAEKASGIDHLKNKVESLKKFDLEYFNPKLQNLFYKEGLPDTLIDSINEHHKDTIEELKILEALIEEKSKDIYVEV